MGDRYHIDTERYSLKRFKEGLASREMIPSRVVLKEDLEERLQIIESRGITNLKELMDRLKTKPKIEAFAKESGLPTDYLILLNREAKSYLPNPVRLDKFPGVENDDINRLEALGIKNSRHLFNSAKKNKDREQLAEATGINIKRLDELLGLSDLSRVYGVGPVFARILFDLGIKSTMELVGYSGEEIIRIYEQATQKKADFGIAEIQFTLDLARELTLAEGHERAPK
jgi:hypothetical protein